MKIEVSTGQWNRKKNEYQHRIPSYLSSASMILLPAYKKTLTKPDLLISVLLKSSK